MFFALIKKKREKKEDRKRKEKRTRHYGKKITISSSFKKN